MPAVIGKLDRRITIQNYVSNIDAYGGETLTPAILAEVWAGLNLSPGSVSREDLEGAQIISKRESVFTIRYRNDIDEKMTILYEGKKYNIGVIREKTDHRKRYLEITAEVKDSE
jgi:SPP1 family predicted phage head-tail adaptor